MRRYKKLLYLILLINIIALPIYFCLNLRERIPKKIILSIDKEENYNLKLPITADIEVLDVGAININNEKIPSSKININLNKPFTLESKKKGKANVSLKLLGIIKLKNIQIEVVDEIEVIPSAKSVGIYIDIDGVLVLGTGKITGEDGLYYEPALNKLKSGDYIMEVNNKKIKDKYELIDEINKCRGDKIKIKYKREGTLNIIDLNPIKVSENEYKLGIWVRDNTQGIGTLTFITKDGGFGALGHGITDIDTGILMDIKEGSLYESEIVSIIKGRDGSPGELVGRIRSNDSNKIGTIIKNNEQGIYGEITNDKYSEGDFIKVGFKQEIKKGIAYIKSNLEGEEVDYEIIIESVDLSNKKHNKGIVLKITDQRLIDATGGIVQGMSGSPIIQNDKIVGAITHVFIKDSIKGYGTFIENMLDNVE